MRSRGEPASCVYIVGYMYVHCVLVISHVTLFTTCIDFSTDNSDLLLYDCVLQFRNRQGLCLRQPLWIHIL